MLVVWGSRALNGLVASFPKMAVTSEARGGPPVRPLAIVASSCRSCSNLAKLVTDSAVPAPRFQLAVALAIRYLVFTGCSKYEDCTSPLCSGLRVTASASTTVGAPLLMSCICAVRRSENFSDGEYNPERRPPEFLAVLMLLATRVPLMMLTAGFFRLAIGLLPMESMKPSSDR